MKILVVDDSRAMRLIIRRTLREAGFDSHEVVEATNGAEALELIRTKAPDVVLSDWNMPEMSGIDLLVKVKAEGLPPQFGFVTSESTDEMAELAKSNGAAFLIVKPFTAQVFEQVLGPFLGGS